MDAPTRNPPIYLDENGNPTTTPPAPTTPTPPPATTTPAAGGLKPVVTDPRNAAGRGVPIEQYIRDWQAQFGYAPTVASLDTLVSHLRNEGYDVKRADHNGQPSNDKLDIGNGRGLDVIASEGASNAAWALQPYGSGSGAAGGGAFDMSQYDTGPFTKAWPGSFPTFTKAPAYQPTTGAEVLADPGYRFGVDEGQRQLQQSAAAKGLLNTGGTLKDLYRWGNSYSNTFFDNVDARRRADYQTNYGTQTIDPYKYAYQNAMDNYNQFRNRQNDSWNKVFQADTA